MKESDLYEPVKAWLKGQGCTKVVPEVPFYYSPIDVVGIGKDLVIGVELKVSLTRKLIHQACTIQVACDRVYVGVPTQPRNLARATELGLGVLRVHEGQATLLSESDNKHMMDWNKERIAETCARMSEKGIGGVPCLEGVGPAQDCKRAADEYRAKNPNATWRELFERVPNHYASHDSMRNALTIGLALRARWKEMRRKSKAMV